MRKPTLSPTRIATYLECAVKYRYIYVDRIGRYYLRARPGLSFGTTLHSVLRSFHSVGGPQTATEIQERYQESWISAGFESEEQEAALREAGAAMVRAYHEAAAGRAESGAETLFTEKVIRTDIGPFILSGRIDRLDRHPDGALEVIDYKTGRWETSPEEVAADLAMNIYQLILRRSHPGTRIIATIYCLRSGLQASAEMTAEEAARFESDIRAIGTEIISREWDEVRPIPIAACEQCEFLSRCTRYWRALGAVSDA